MNIRQFVNGIIHNSKVDDNSLKLTIGFPIVVEEDVVDYFFVNKSSGKHLVVEIDDRFKFEFVIDDMVKDEEAEFTYKNGVLTMEAPIKH